MGWNSPRRGLSSSGGDRFGVARVSITLTAELISIINRILSTELEGVRLDCIRMFLVQDYTDERLQGPYHQFDAIEVPIHFNLRGWVERSQPPGALQRPSHLFRRTVTWQVPSDRVIAGSISCWTDRGEFRSLNEEELHELFQSVGYHANRQAAA
jgi:hypothetical protein